VAWDDGPRTRVEWGEKVRKKKKRRGDVQVVPYYSRTENAYGEEVTTQTRATEE